MGFGQTKGVPFSQSVPTIQTMDLLEAPITSDIKGALGGGDITIVDNVALAPDQSPFDGSIIVRPASDQISTYIVRKGDTLSEIAEMFDVSPNTIKWANNLGVKGTIVPGQTLVILPVTGVQHIVKKGDTLKSIAKKYHGDETDILDYNGLENASQLAIGDEIVIPNGEIAVPAPTKNTAGVSTPRGTNAPSYAGYYMRPITGGVKTQGIHGYNAVDLAAPIGTPIYAAAAGTVVISREGGWNGGYGNYIVIQHDNGTQTLYSHNSSNVVGVGETVSQGQTIAYMGQTGKATGSHVHFEIRGAKNPF